MSLRKMKQQFHCISRFPNVVRAIDVTLISIKGMSGDEKPIYVSRKNFYALNIQGVVDADMFVQILFANLYNAVHKYNHFKTDNIVFLFLLNFFNTIKRCYTLTLYFRFLNINRRFQGRTHDAYAMSNIPGIMANHPEGGWLLGDSGYPFKDFLMTPFNSPSTQMEESYNHAHCPTRNVIVRAFSVLKSRFRHVVNFKNIMYIFHLI